MKRNAVTSFVAARLLMVAVLAAGSATGAASPGHEADRPDGGTDVTWGETSGSAACFTHLASFGVGDDGPYKGERVLFARPGEQLSLLLAFQVNWLPPRQRAAPSLDFSWFASSGFGQTTPATGEGTLLLRDDRVEADGVEYAGHRGLIRATHTASEREGQYPLAFVAALDATSTRSAGVSPSCWKRREDWTVVVGGAQYGISIRGQYATKDGSQAGLVVAGRFDIDSRGQVSGQATHENWILGECVQYRDSMPETIDGWIEDGKVRLRLNKAGEAVATTDSINTQDPSCLFKGLKELGTLLALVGGDVARQAGAPGTGTADLPGGLKLPGEILYPVLKPGQTFIQRIGNLRYSISRRE